MADVADETIDPTDPREKLRKYLLDQQQRRARMDDPEYRKSVNADTMGSFDANAGGALASGLMASAAQMGAINGKVADSDSVGQTADRLSRARAGFDAKMEGEKDDREKRYGMDAKVYEYLAGKKQAEDTAAQTSKDRKDRLAKEDEWHKNQNKTMADNKAGTAKEKVDKQTDAEFERFNDHIRGSVRDSIGAEKGKLRASTHAMRIMDNPDLNKLNAIQVKEIAGALAAQVTQGSPAERTLQEMTPQTAAGDLAKVYAYITGKPAPANQGEYVSFFKDMVKRQRDTSLEIIKGELAPTVATYGHLRGKDKARFDQIMAGAGMSLDENNQLVAYEPSYAREAGPAPLDEKPGSGTALAAPKKQYKVGEEKVIGGVVNVKGADGLWNPK